MFLASKSTCKSVKASKKQNVSSNQKTKKKENPNDLISKNQRTCCWIAAEFVVIMIWFTVQLMIWASKARSDLSIQGHMQTHWSQQVVIFQILTLRRIKDAGMGIESGEVHKHDMQQRTAAADFCRRFQSAAAILNSEFFFNLRFFLAIKEVI